MSKNVMMMEGKGSRKRKAVKTTKKQSVVNRKLRSLKRQAQNVLGLVGLFTLVIVLVRLVLGG